MSDTVLVALLAFGGTAIGTIVGAIVSSKVTDLRLKNLETQVEAISKKQDNYYTLDRRLLILETRLGTEDE